MKLFVVLMVALVPLVLLGSGPASANSQQTFSGTLGGLSNTSFTLDCANNGGYVKGVGDSKTKPWTQVPFQVRGTLNLNIVYVPVAQNTVPFAFLSRAVTSMSVTVQHLYIGDVRWEVDYSCTSNINEAWRVLG
jgi:hypothetical protein